MFKFVNAGFRTSDLTNLQFVLAFGHIAIRFTKSGTFQVRAHRTFPCRKASTAFDGKCALRQRARLVTALRRSAAARHVCVAT